MNYYEISNKEVVINRIGQIVLNNLGINTEKLINMSDDELRILVENKSKAHSFFCMNTMPYLFHKKYWKECGPWELILDKNIHLNSQKKGYCDSPDNRFFERCHNAGAKFTMSRSSICYHHEAVERRGKRPKGTEDMVNEDGIEGKT